MVFASLRFISILILIGIAQSRVLKLNSSSDNLTSDGVDHFNNRTSYVSVPSACDHQYGFFPCAENAGGFVFQILVYQGLLIYGEKQIGSGSKVLFNIIGVGKIGGIIFRILMSLPSMMLMIVSGVFSSKETAQSLVSVGVGIYAGITVFSLTLQWAICVISGRRDLPQNQLIDDSPSSCFPARKALIVLKDTGVTLDKKTKITAGIMLLSLIPYIIVQLDSFTTTPLGARINTLIALVVSIVSLVSYFAYQIWNPWIQERSLDYSKYELLRREFLNHVQRQGKLVDENGKLNRDFIKKLFDDVDKDDDNCVNNAEIEKLVLEIIGTGKMKLDKRFAVKEIMKTFDYDDDRRISEEEFINGCKKWIDEASSQSQKTNSSSSLSQELINLVKDKKDNDPLERDRIMSKLLTHAETQLLKNEALVTPDGKPNVERIKTLFMQFDSDGDKSISKNELEQLLRTVNFGESQPKYEEVVRDLFKDFDKDDNNQIDEQEFNEGIKAYIQKAINVSKAKDKTKAIGEFHEIAWEEGHSKWDLISSILKITFGIALLTFLGGPLMTSILQLSYAMDLPSFSISFVIVPLAMNARAAIAAILPASHKSKRAASLTFSEIYGGVIMNNISGMTALLAIVFAKDLTWDFSAEVLTILVVCAIVGGLAYSCKSYPTWTCIVALLLYPFSLGLFYVAQSFWSWN